MKVCSACYSTVAKGVGQDKDHIPPMLISFSLGCRFPEGSVYLADEEAGTYHIEPLFAIVGK